MGFDIFKIFRSLVRESVSAKSYKKMHPALAVLCFIVVSPFVVLYIGMLIVYLVMATVYKLVHSAFDYLYAFVHGEGKVVKPAAQAVIYLIGFPLLFAFKVVYSILIYPIVFFHFFTSHVGYIATFGGIKYSPFMFESVDRTEKFPNHCLAAVIVFVILGMILFTASLLFRHVTLEVYNYNKEATIKAELVAEMQQAVKDGKLETSVYNNGFLKDYKDDRITAENYLQYSKKYLGDNAEVLWDVEKEIAFTILIERINIVIICTYISFTILYVSIYSNVIKRRMAVA